MQANKQLTAFQFQDGAIKGVMINKLVVADTIFQFQDGAIKGCKCPSSRVLRLRISIPRWCD